MSPSLRYTEGSRLLIEPRVNCPQVYENAHSSLMKLPHEISHSLSFSRALLLITKWKAITVMKSLPADVRLYFWDLTLDKWLCGVAQAEAEALINSCHPVARWSPLTHIYAPFSSLLTSCFPSTTILCCCAVHFAEQKGFTQRSWTMT